MRRARCCSSLCVAGVGAALLGLLAPLSGAAQGLIPEEPAVYRSFPPVPRYRAFLPPSMDISSRFPRPRDQGSQSSCVGWAVGYALRTYYESLNQGWDLDDEHHLFSPAFLYNRLQSSAAVVHNSCSAGTRISDALNLLRHDGIASLADFPYDPQRCSLLPDPQLESVAQSFRIEDWRVIDTESVGALDDIKGQLAQGNPVVFGMNVPQNFHALKPDQIYDDTQSTPRFGHAMVVVGYSEPRQAFKIMNSWGSNWGDGGFGWVSYHAFRQSAKQAFVVRMGARPTPMIPIRQPVVVAMVTPPPPPGADAPPAPRPVPSTTVETTAPAPPAPKMEPPPLPVPSPPVVTIAPAPPAPSPPPAQKMEPSPAPPPPSPNVEPLPQPRPPPAPAKIAPAPLVLPVPKAEPLPVPDPAPPPATQTPAVEPLAVVTPPEPQVVIPAPSVPMPPPATPPALVPKPPAAVATVVAPSPVPPPPPEPPAPAPSAPAPARRHKAQTAELTALVQDRLRAYQCAKLDLVDSPDGRSVARGFVASQEDHDRLQGELSALDGEGRVATEVEIDPWPLCEALLTLDAPLRDDGGLSVSIASAPGQSRPAVLAEGEPLAIDVETPDFPSYLYVTYVDTGGDAIQLYSPPGALSRALPPRTRMTLGAGAGQPSYRIGPPFGREMVVAVASASPLFDETQPLSETERQYLTDFRAAYLTKSASGKSGRRVAASVATLITRQQPTAAAP